MPWKPRASWKSSRSSVLPVSLSQTVRRAASMTPPVVPKIAPAPEAVPSGLSKSVSGSWPKERPTYLMSLMSSRVVSTMSTSCRPSRPISGRAASNFFAVQGMTDTVTMSLGSMPAALG